MPLWALEIQLMEAFGWTERELNEEVSFGTVQRILVYMDIREQAEKVREQRERLKSTHQHGSLRFR